MPRIQLVVRDLVKEFEIWEDGVPIVATWNFMAPSYDEDSVRFLPAVVWDLYFLKLAAELFEP